jgi:hypothetical protein
MLLTSRFFCFFFFFLLGGADSYFLWDFQGCSALPIGKRLSLSLYKCPRGPREASSGTALSPRTWDSSHFTMRLLVLSSLLCILLLCFSIFSSEGRAAPQVCWSWATIPVWRKVLNRNHWGEQASAGSQSELWKDSCSGALAPEWQNLNRWL